MQRVARAMALHGIETLTFNFPYMDAGRSAPDRAPVLEAHYAKVWKDLTRGATPPFYATGKSMGGRIASQVAAQTWLRPGAGRADLLRVSPASAKPAQQAA